MNIVSVALWMKEHHVREIKITSDIFEDGMTFVRTETFGTQTTFKMESDGARDVYLTGTDVVIISDANWEG